MAYILVNVELGAEEEILREVKKLSGVVEAHALYGTFDLIIKVEVESMDELRKHLYEKIRAMDKVRSTTTMMVSDKFR